MFPTVAAAELGWNSSSLGSITHYYNHDVVLQSVSSLLLPIASYFLCRGRCSTSSFSAQAISPHGNFTGRTIAAAISGDTLPQSVDAFLGISYVSHQPVGQHRFERAEKAPSLAETKALSYNARHYSPICVQSRRGKYTDTMEESCLTLNIFRPTDTTEGETLPVAIYIHGGAFNSGSARDFDGASFVGKSREKVMVVSINYRLGVFGFPSSPAFDELGLLNLGLTDQVTALQWIIENIHYFGGDPNNLTLLGLSAGGHSIGYHILNMDEDAPKFARAAMFSGSATARQYPPANYTLYKKQWSELLVHVQCSDAAEDGAQATLNCLRDVEGSTLGTASSSVFALYDYHITWPWQPVLGGALIPRPATVSYEAGLFKPVPIMTGFCHDEGRLFAPTDLDTTAEYLAYFRNLAPNMTEEHITKLGSLYPGPEEPDSPYAGSPYSSQFARLAAAYGDAAYACQTQETAVRLTEAGMDVYKYHFMQNNFWPTARGIPHSCDYHYEYYDSAVESLTVGRDYHGFISSFVATGDPNKVLPLELDDDDAAATDRAVWEAYGSGNGKQMRFLEDDTAMEDDALRREECEFWRSIPDELYH